MKACLLKWPLLKRCILLVVEQVHVGLVKQLRLNSENLHFEVVIVEVLHLIRG